MKTCVLHQNLLEPTEEWQTSIAELNPARLKIALLNQGARISSAARHSLAWNGGMREGVYHSLDLGIGDRKYNAPLGTKLASLSPFEIDCNHGAYFLRYYGRKITEVSLDMPQPRLTKLTKGKIPVDRICFLATDRVRIQNSSFCTYVEKNVKCRFCEAISLSNTIRYRRCSGCDR